jgi:hypothetical protein
MNKIIVVGGGKGGVGKSMVTMAGVDALRSSAHETIYVETDDSNPDVYKAVEKEVPSEICNLDDEAGYVRLGGIIESHTEAYIVINTAARATDSLIKHSGILHDVAHELNRELVMVWPVNRQRDSLELLRQFLDGSEPYSAVFGLLNTYFGPAEKFTRYLSSKLKDRVTGTITFPELNDLVADKLTDNRLATWNADEKLTIAERSVLRRFRDASRAALQPVYG